jgi:death on curing protein
VKYLYPKQIIYLYRQIVGISGGSHGLRNKGILKSAVYRLQASFGGQDLYPDLLIKTAVLGHSLINNHAFIDGNKRVGFEAMRLMLRLNGYDIHASINDKFKFTMKIAEKKLTENDIAQWVKSHSKTYEVK